MNPLYKALAGGQNGLSQAVTQQMNAIPSGPTGGIQSVMERARSMMQNPQQTLRQFLPGLPDDMANDPNAILNWLQQTGRVSPQQMQTAQQIGRMRGGR